MVALATRAFVQEDENYYLCPLPKTQLSDVALAEYLVSVWADKFEPTLIFRTCAMLSTPQTMKMRLFLYQDSVKDSLGLPNLLSPFVAGLE